MKDLEKFNRVVRLGGCGITGTNGKNLGRNCLKSLINLIETFTFSLLRFLLGMVKNTPFWESRWINGRSPRELAPKLYKSTEYKYRNVHTELKNNNWIRSFGNIQSSSLLEEFTLMFMDLSSMQLRQQKYVIKWR
jgi:hypothetical protein